MHTYAALLRGINLGSRNRVPMVALRELLSRNGFARTRTHLQSGNVVFSHASGDPVAIASSVRRLVADEFGVDVAVVLRSSGEIDGVVTRNPLGAEPEDPARFLVAFLDSTPDTGRARELRRRDFGADRIWLSGREVYFWCPGGLRDSELGKLAWDKALGVTATARNWNTVTRLATMVGD